MIRDIYNLIAVRLRLMQKLPMYLYKKNNNHVKCANRSYLISLQSLIKKKVGQHLGEILLNTNAYMKGGKRSSKVF